MSLPPAVVHIKRKRESDAPPSFLQIENTVDDQYFDGHEAKRTSGVWVFQRVHADDLKLKSQTKSFSSTRNSREVKIPEIKTSQPGDELRPLPRKILDTKRKTPPIASISSPPAASTASAAEANDATYTPPRRFHLTRASRITRVTPKISKDGIHKTSTFATFVERRKTTSKTTSRGVAVAEVLAGKGTGSNLVNIHMPSATPVTDTPVKAVPEKPLGGTEDGVSRTQKKPGRNANRFKAPSTVPNAQPNNTSDKHAAEPSEELAAELQKFALETMSPSAETLEPSQIKSSPYERFKPKAPAQRYRERHPTPTTQQPQDHDMDLDDDSDLETHTYIRVPAHTLQTVPTDMGVLVLENEEEIEQFYNYADDSSDDSDAIFDDEIDENAEGNPNNDYPDEEGEDSSDDDFGMNSYNYRANASDDEEADSDEAHYSDDGEDLPWTERAWGKKPKPTWEGDHDMES